MNAVKIVIDDTMRMVGEMLLYDESASTPTLGRRNISAPVEYRAGNLLRTTLNCMKSSTLKKRCYLSDCPFREAQDFQGELLFNQRRCVFKRQGFFKTHEQAKIVLPHRPSR
jgi:hypothetical protein